VDLHNVVGQVFNLLSPAGQVFYHDALASLDFTGADHQVTLRMRLTDNNLIASVLIGKRIGFAVGVPHMTRKQSRNAGTASTIAAAIGQAESLVQCGVEDGFSGFNGKLMLTVLDPDLECHAAFQ
jgi:hypothetical protein